MGKNIGYIYCIFKRRAIISDEFSQKLIDEVIVPNFSEEKYFKGINEAIVKINEKIIEED